MIVIVCVDENRGMMFHWRRQSQDRMLREDVLRECEGKKLYMSPYSYRMFEKEMEERCEEGREWRGRGAEICVQEEFFGEVGEGEFCFVEGQDISAVKEKIQSVILYQWNRRYPADVYFTMDLESGDWEVERQEEFRGSSHERITKVVYRKTERG